jgi:hypothetical protein
MEFIRANGTPVPVASPPRLVVTGSYRYVRNPIYVGFLAVLIGEVLVFGSLGLLEYAAVAWCVGAAGVRFYEEPTLARKLAPTTATTGARSARGFPGCILGRPPGQRATRQPQAAASVQEPVA